MILQRQRSGEEVEEQDRASVEKHFPDLDETLRRLFLDETLRKIISQWAVEKDYFSMSRWERLFLNEPVGKILLLYIFCKREQMLFS